VFGRKSGGRVNRDCGPERLRNGVRAGTLGVECVQWYPVEGGFRDRLDRWFGWGKLKENLERSSGNETEKGGVANRRVKGS